MPMFDPLRIDPYPPELRYTWIPVLPGQELIGWCLCSPCGCKTHYFKQIKQTKPCRFWCSKGKLPCTLGEKCKPREISYWALHLKGSDERVVVTLSRTPTIRAQLIAVGTPVRLFRPVRKNNPPIEVTALVGTDDPSVLTTKNMARRPPEDITPYIMHLWQDEELTRVCGGEFRPSAATERKGQ